MLFNCVALALGFSATIKASSLSRTAAVGPASVNLRTAGGFTVLAETGISTVPASVITGNIGVSPITSTAITGFSLALDSTGTFATSQQVVGQVFASSFTSPTPSQLITAVSDVHTAFTDANGRVSPDFTDLAVGLIGGQTLVPGLYTWSTAVNALSGFTIAGGPTDTWIFQVASTLGLANDAIVTLTGGALAENIVWVVSGAVTLGTGSHFEGVVLGLTAITVETGASVNGRLLAQTSVALQAATITP